MTILVVRTMRAPGSEQACGDTYQHALRDIESYRLNSNAQGTHQERSEKAGYSSIPRTREHEQMFAWHAR